MVVIMPICPPASVPSIPVIAAGGFADGRGLAAALVMGASGVQIGTRFLLAEECPAHPQFKEKLIGATDTDTAVTGFLSGHSVRGVRNAFTERFLDLERKGTAWEILEKMATGTNRMAAVEGEVESGMVQAGQSLLPLKKIEPAKLIVENIMSEARQVLSGASSLL